MRVQRSLTNHEKRYKHVECGFAVWSKLWRLVITSLCQQHSTSWKISWQSNTNNVPESSMKSVVQLTSCVWPTRWHLHCITNLFIIMLASNWSMHVTSFLFTSKYGICRLSMQLVKPTDWTLAALLMVLKRVPRAQHASQYLRSDLLPLALHASVIIFSKKRYLRRKQFRYTIDVGPLAKK